MQFSDTTNKNGLIQNCEDTCELGDAGISGQSTLLKQFTSKINVACHQVWSWIFQAYGGWKYDDTQYTDLPQATTNLVAGQRRYSMPSNTLSVQRIDVTDSAGNITKLTALPEERIEQVGVAGFLKDDGIPQYYRVTNGTIELFPASKVSITDGMEVFFDRPAVEFASTATTATPGFASPYHYLVYKIASAEWLKIKKPDSATLRELKQDIASGKEDLIAYYNKRWRDLQPRIETPVEEWN